MTDEQLNEHVSDALLESAVDYVRVGCDAALGGSSTGWKYAVLHVFAGIELLLKSRLASTDWKQIFSKPEKANQDQIVSGDFHSVGLERAKERLQDIAKIEIGGSTYATIKSLQNDRNKIQHYGMVVSEAVAKSLAEKGAFIFMEFATTHFDGFEFEDVREKIKELEGYVDFRLSEIQPELDDASLVLECPKCSQKAVACGGGECRCLFCEAEFTPEDMALEEAHKGYDPGDPPRDIYNCPECDSLTCITLDDVGLACTGCGEKTSLEPCDCCNSNLIDLEETSICNDCFIEKCNREG